MVGPKAKGGSMYPQRSLQQGTARRQGHSEVVQEKGVHKQENLVILKKVGTDHEVQSVWLEVV